MQRLFTLAHQTLNFQEQKKLNTAKFFIENNKDLNLKKKKIQQ